MIKLGRLWGPEILLQLTQRQYDLREQTTRTETVFRLRRCERIEGRTLQKSFSKDEQTLDGPIFGGVGLGIISGTTSGVILKLIVHLKFRCLTLGALVGHLGPLLEVWEI